MDNQLKTNLTSSEHWTRFVYMLLFALFLYIATILAAVLVVAQFIFALVTGAPNVRLHSFGFEVTQYINQVWLFLTYNSEEKAFPFSDWPSSASVETVSPATEQAVEPEPTTIVTPPPSSPEPAAEAEPPVAEPDAAQSEDDLSKKTEKMD